MTLGFVTSFSIPHQRHKPWKEELIRWTLFKCKIPVPWKTLSRNSKGKPLNGRQYLQEAFAVKYCHLKYVKKNIKIPNQQTDLKMYLSDNTIEDRNMANKQKDRFSISYYSDNTN